MGDGVFQEAFCAHGLFCLSSIAYVFKFSFESACFFLFLFFVFLYIAYIVPGIILGIKMHTIIKSRKKGSISRVKLPA